MTHTQVVLKAREIICCCISTGTSDAYNEEYLEQLAEINDEEPPELDLDEEEESEIEANERMKSSIIEQYEEQVESVSLLQVIY